MRYLPLDATEREAMLARIGVPDIEALFADISADTRTHGLLDMPRAKSEMAVERAMTTIARRSLAAGSAPFFLGAGAYRRHIPATVDHLIQRSEFLTSYTPYQPEIAQGTLQVLFEFQTQVAALTGMEVANASMYDGSTACGEAMLMAHRLTRRNRSVISGGLHSAFADVCATLAHMADDRIFRLAPDLKARVLAMRLVLVALTWDSSRRAPRMCARCPGVSPARRWTQRDVAASCSPSRRASSTSAERRRQA